MSVHKYRVHVVFTAAELDRPYSWRTDVFASSVPGAWQTAGFLFQAMTLQAGLTDAIMRQSLSCERVPEPEEESGPGRTPGAAEGAETPW